MKHSRSGFALQELVVSLAVMVTLLGGLFTFMRSGMVTSQLTTSRALLDRSAQQVMRQIVKSLMAAGTGTLSPAVAPLGSSFLDFQVPEAVTSAGIQWDAASRIEWQSDPADPADGADNNGNGLVDEGRVVVRNDFGLASERLLVLASGVARLLEGENANFADDNGNGLQDESGLSFERTADGGVTVRLTLQKSNRHGVLSRTVESTLVPRN